MIKNTFTPIMRWLTLLCCWLTLSPLFVYLAGRWKLIGKKLRILLLLFSPLLLFVYLILFLMGVQGYYDNRRKHHFADEQVIGCITGVTFPELHIIDYQKGKTSFLGDYSDKLVMQMGEALNPETYHYLDSIIKAGHPHWSFRDNQYSYSRIWGNGFPAPEGQNDEEDVMFSLSFQKGSDTLTLNYGAW